MSKKDQQRKREIYDIPSLLKAIDANSIQMEPDAYSEEKMPVFAANVNLRRQIPEIKDGLIPVQRRILMTLYHMGLYNGKITKSLQVIGDTIRYYHPHGDSSVYSAMVRMAQPWANNVNFIKGKGNFGTAYDTNSYAHQRYTECTMSDFAYDCYFSDWKMTSPKNDMVVDWVPNYDESRLEPMHLPCKYPVFLMNHRRSMGLGRYCGLLGFSITDSCNAVIQLIKDPDADFPMYPDDPEGSDLVNAKDFKSILDKTDITAKFRAGYTINHYDGKDVIEITSTPFEVNPQTIKESIKAAAEKGKIPEISDIDGSSSDFGKKFMLSIEVRRGYDAHQVMKNIYKLTQAENTYVAKYAFVNGLQSVDYTLRIAILEWIRARRETLRRIYKSERVIITRRIHFLEPLIKVIESGQIDEFIKIVRSNDEDVAVRKIMSNWKLTDYQATRIIGVKISDLSKDKLVGYKRELKDLKQRENELDSVTSDHNELDKVIIRQMEECIQKYGTPRKSRITQLIDSEQIADTTHYLIFTNRYVKKLPYDERGYKVGRIDTNEKVLKVMVANNKDTIAVFTADGRCNPIRVNDIGNSNVQSVGISYTQCGAKDNSFVDAINISEQDQNTNGKCLVTLTEQGLISKTSLDDLEEKDKSFVLMKLGKDDRMISVDIASEDDRIIVFTKLGKAAVFPADDFETTSYNTKGVQAAKIPDGDKLVGVATIHMGDENIVTLTDRGYVKKININNMPATKRNGRVIEISSGSGQLTDVVSVSNSSNDPLFICTTSGVFQLDHMIIKATNRLGKPERAAELKITDYAFEIMYR